MSNISLRKNMKQKNIQILQIAVLVTHVQFYSMAQLA